MGFFSSKKDKMKKFEQFTPEQQQLFQRIMQMTGEGSDLDQGYGDSISQLQEYLDPSSAAYQRFAAPYMQQFEQETIPGIAERFAGQGAMGGALSSSGFGQALSSAGSNLQTQLAGMKTDLQRQAMNDLMQQYGGMADKGLNAQPFGYSYQQGSPSTFQSMLQGYAQGGFPGMASGFSGGFGRGRQASASQAYGVRG